MAVSSLICFFDIVDKLAKDFERLINEDTPTTEPGLQHLCAQAGRVFDGLRSIESYKTASITYADFTDDEQLIARDFCQDVQLLSDWFLNIVIPSLHERLDSLCYVGRLDCWDNQAVCNLDMDQVMFMKSIGHGLIYLVY